MKLIIGLGNPGKEYEKTRHNAGFLAVDKIASGIQYSVFSIQPKFNAEISQGIIDDEKIMLVKPMTFMNNSGQTVRAILDYYKINPEDIIVIHDDLDIPLGEYKISEDRGSAGHKGVQSVIDCLGTKEFARIRIGIGTKQAGRTTSSDLPVVENKKIPTEKFVLEKFSGNEMEIIEKVIDEVNNKIVELP
jgi:PTH1 family peptidyl-tRNA hydrolase